MADGHAPAPDGVVPMIDVTRGDVVESRHFGAAAVVTADGTVVNAWGDVEWPVYPRSSLKPLQALSLLETGAADAFGLGDAEIAIACASHSGSAAHVATVAAMLDKIGLDESALACGPRDPADSAEAARLVREGMAPGRAHNGCSGKHAAMLLTAHHLGAPTEGYHRVTHPVQQRVIGIVEQMTGLDLGAVRRAIDGCSLPIWALPLGNLALAMARLADRFAMVFLAVTMAIAGGAWRGVGPVGEIMLGIRPLSSATGIGRAASLAAGFSKSGRVR